MCVPKNSFCKVKVCESDPHFSHHNSCEGCGKPSISKWLYNGYSVLHDCKKCDVCSEVLKNGEPVDIIFGSHLDCKPCNGCDKAYNGHFVNDFGYHDWCDPLSRKTMNNVAYMLILAFSDKKFPMTDATERAKLLKKKEHILAIRGRVDVRSACEFIKLICRRQF
jgi:hypothetical protein